MEENLSGDMPFWVVILIPFAFLIIFPVLWCFVIWMMSHIGGWSRLAKSYRTDREPNGTTWHGVQGKIGLASYKGSLTCTADDRGLFLEPSLVFRFAHPRLFIPWSDFHKISRQRILWFTFVKARIGDPPVGSLALDAKIFEESEGRKLLGESGPSD